MPVFSHFRCQITIFHFVIEALCCAVEGLGHMRISLFIERDGAFEILEMGVARQDIGIMVFRGRINDRIGSGEFMSCRYFGSTAS